MSFGIAFAGGGSRGAAHVGVLLALEENGLFPSSIAGTSAGGIVAGLYASGVSAKELKEMVENLSRTGYFLIDPNYKGIVVSIKEFLMRKPITMTGLIKGSRLERYLNEKSGGKKIEEAIILTVIPAVDLFSGKTVAYTNAKIAQQIDDVIWKGDALLSDAMRASLAVPAVFEPKMMDGMCLVDGGVTDVLPVNLLIAAGEANVLAVDLSESYRSPKNLNIIEIANHSLSIMGNALRRCTTTEESLLLHPSLPVSAGLLTFDDMEDCMEAGYDATIKMMPTIKRIFRSSAIFVGKKAVSGP